MAGQAIGRSWSRWMADTVLEKFPRLDKKWSYDYGVVCKGLEAVYEMTGEQAYFDYIRACMDGFITDDGIRFYEKNQYNLDNINNGKVLLYLSQKTGDDKYSKVAGLLRQQLKEHPRTKSGGFWHKKVYPYQMWLDGIYMAQPFYAQYIGMFDETKDFSDVIRQFELIEEHLRDDKTKLLYHGWDESGESFWADKETGRSKNFWGRSIGWYACALVDTLDHVKDDRLIGMVKNLAEGLKNYQSKTKGVWYQVVDREEEFGNYPECSCSCMFTYFLMKAVNEGYIDASYTDTAKNAFNSIIREFIEVDEKGFLNLHGTVYGAGLGGDTRRDGSYEYYVSEPRQLNHLHGIGSFMMAAVQSEKSLYDMEHI